VISYQLFSDVQLSVVQLSVVHLHFSLFTDSIALDIHRLPHTHPSRAFGVLAFSLVILMT